MHDLFGNRVAVVRSRLRYADFSYVPADDWLHFFATYFGPMITAFERLERYQRDTFVAEPKELADESNCAEDGGLTLKCEYGEVVMQQR